MRITWNIEKKRGNFRPLLRYTISLEEHESELAVNTINIKSSIAKLENGHENFCLPETFERHDHWQATDFHYIATPYFKNGTVSESLRLPYRESGLYPEVEESFGRLRAEFEKTVQAAYGSAPIVETKEMETTDETKSIIAAHIATRKMTKLFGKSTALV